MSDAPGTSGAMTTDADLDHLRHMLAIHERAAATTTRTADEKRAARRLVRQYEGWIYDRLEGGA